MSINKLLEWLNPKVSCDACGRLFTDDWSFAFHESRCIDDVIGYDLYHEKITPETRAYFFRQKEARRINNV